MVAWADSLDTSADTLWKKLQAIDSLSAQFTQSVYGADGTLVQESAGTLSVRKPGFMRWEANSPYAETVVIDGARIWFYDIDLEQVNVRDFHQDLRELPAMVFTADQAGLAESFVVTQTGEQQYELTPRDAHHYVRKLSLRWDGTLPAELVIEDNLANRTHLQFTDVHINQVTDNSLFEFTVPAGVDVLDQAGQPQP